MNVKLQQAIGAARAGESQKAQVLLAQILKEDTKNVHAWFLLSHLVESKDKKLAFLHKVLELEPTHQKAQERLAELTMPKPVPVVEPEAVSVAVEEVVEETAVVAEPEEQPTPIIFTEPADDNLFQTDDSNGFFADDEDDLPAWLTATNDEILTPEALAAEALPEFSDAIDSDDLPDWLTKTNIDDWTVEKPWEQAEDLFADIEFEEDDEPEATREVPKPIPVKSVIDVARERQQPDPPPPAPEKSPTKNDSWLNRVLILLIVVAAIVLILLLYIVITSLG